MSPQAPLTTRATHLAGHTLTYYLQLCQRRFQCNPPLQHHHSPFLLVCTHIGGHTGLRTPPDREGFTLLRMQNLPFPAEADLARVRIVWGHGNRYHEALGPLEGGPHNLYSIMIQDIVEPCGQGHSGRHPTHKSVFLLPG